jgi:hypothetical protein
MLADDTELFVFADVMTGRKYILCGKSVQQSSDDLIAFRLCTAADSHEPGSDSLREGGFSALG